ncbi:MAG: DUF1576 domain-containing protein [Lachnospiraceae bacterium]|jgi:hypothetical protein|nr:DUF1576 domain-containing protein [Lachnospiraceae bacterium]
MAETWLERIKGKELKIFCIYSIALCALAAFLFADPLTILTGLRKIVVSRDALITDYFELASYGSGFANAALVMSISLILIISQKLPFTGLSITAIFINVGYAFWGKNPVNILPIFLGVFLYAKLHKASFSRYLFTALYGACLAPLVTEFAYFFPLPGIGELLLAALIGVCIGFVLPPLVMHTASMHQGYSLFNAGFAAGILAFVIVCVLKSFGVEGESVFIWKAQRHPAIMIGFSLYFLSTFLFGLFLTRGKLSGMKHIWGHPGRAVADFVIMDGVGYTLINMGLVGLACMAYVTAVGGDFSGPVLGAILTAFGYAAFGAHLRNYLPVMAGVFLFGVVSNLSPTSPGILLAAIFAAGLSPVAGQFGILAGILAGILHGAISIHTADMYGGLNLYNNGFSAGWVAIVIVPCLESFIKQFSSRKDTNAK